MRPNLGEMVLGWFRASDACLHPRWLLSADIAYGETVKKSSQKLASKSEANAFNGGIPKLCQVTMTCIHVVIISRKFPMQTFLSGLTKSAERYLHWTSKTSS